MGNIYSRQRQKTLFQAVKLSSYALTCPALFYLACKLRTKSTPPVPNSFIAHIDIAFMQKVFYISQREWKPHIQHNCKLDDLGAGFEIAEK